MKEIESTSFLKSVDLCFNKAAEALKLPKGLARQIRTCNAICEMKFGVELKGGYEILPDGGQPIASTPCRQKAESAMPPLSISKKSKRWPP